MPGEFVPFFPSSGTRSAASAPHAAPNGFAPLASAPPAGAAPRSPAAPAQNHAHEPRVEVKRSGDRVTHIQITCRCGENIQIDCEY